MHKNLSPDDAATGAISTVLELLGGAHEARIFAGGDGRSRVQIKDHMAERDLVQSGDSVWLYDSNSNEATHLSLPVGRAADAHAHAKDAQLSAGLATPTQFAQQLLSELDPSTTVSVGTDSRVAGRSVYQLVLTPKASDTLVASVSIAVDSATGLVLEVSVQAQGQSGPAFQLGFTAIDFAAPPADLFDFVPPANATITEQTLPAVPDASAEPSPNLPADALPTAIGTGWSTIVAIPAASVSAELRNSPMLIQLTTAVNGGRALTTSLVNVFLANDGRVFAGAVPLAQLQAAAQ
jgi:outer membrane lipoprotein-sorting protein